MFSHVLRYFCLHTCVSESLWFVHTCVWCTCSVFITLLTFQGTSDIRCGGNALFSKAVEIKFIYLCRGHVISE